MTRAARWFVLGLAVMAPAAWAGVGSISLTDGSGLEFLINTDVTFSTSSNASGAAMDATYTGAVAATTSAGGSTVAVLSDAFNGYNSLFVNDIPYNLNGAASLKCSGRQVVFEKQVIGALSVQRKVYVPEDDSFCRWLNVIENTGNTTATAKLLVVNSLGSGANTVIAASSVPPLAITTTDDWAVSYQDYVAGKSSDPRLGHVFQGPHRAQGLSSITFAAGNGQPFWEYSISIAAGQTAIVMSFVTGQPSIDAAIDKCKELELVPDTALACLNDTDRSSIVNFDVVAPTCTISSTTTDPTNLATIPVKVTFSESVTGFQKTDIVVTNAEVKHFAGSGTTYTFDVIPTADGEITVNIPAGAAEDIGGNPSAAATEFTRSVDVNGPSVAMSSITRDPSNISTIINVTVTFSEPVNNFTSADLSLVYSTLKSFAAASTSYTQYAVAILPSRVSGEVGIDIAAGVATDKAGNPNTAATFRHTVGPGFSCLGGAKSGDQPVQASFADVAPIAAVVTTLGVATLRRKRRK